MLRDTTPTLKNWTVQSFLNLKGRSLAQTESREAEIAQTWWDGVMGQIFMACKFGPNSKVVLGHLDYPLGPPLYAEERVQVY